jgi:hypothetical protein
MWSVLDDLSLWLRSMAAAALSHLWQRFLWLGWIGKLFAVAIAIYVVGWIVGALGMNDLARGFGRLALYVVAFPITAAIIRGIWRGATTHHRQ